MGQTAARPARAPFFRWCFRVLLASGFDEAHVLTPDTPEASASLLRKPYGVADLLRAIAVALEKAPADGAP